MKNFIKSILKNVDLFQVTPTLFIKKEKKLKTIFGGILTLICISLSLYIIIYSIQN